MNALSMSSNACVEEPRTSASMRIQATSYMKEEAPVTSATPRKRRKVRSLRSCDAGASGGPSCRRNIDQTAAATPRLRSPATRMVPGRPRARMRTNPLASTPAAAPRLLVK